MGEMLLRGGAVIAKSGCFFYFGFYSSLTPSHQAMDRPRALW